MSERPPRMVDTLPLEVSVVVSARNAAGRLAECLESVCRQQPREVIVVDGCSEDTTAEIARSFGAQVLSDGGQGLPFARMLGTRAANCDVVALVDSDVIIPEGALGQLLSEFDTGGFDGLQFGLVSESDGPGYWGEALAWHHNHSRVRSWFGVCATLLRRDVLLGVGFDDSFRSGEDIELRIRLEQSGHRLGVSSTTMVRHRFADTFDCARDQWLQDGAGLGRTVRKHPRRAGWVLLLPLLATGRGLALSMLRAPWYLPYWGGFLFYNYRAMIGQLLRPGLAGLSLGGNAAWLAAARVAPMAVGFIFWALAAFLLPPAEMGLGAAVVSAALLTVQLGLLGVGPATLTLLPPQSEGGRRLIATGLLTVTASSLLVAAGLVLVTHALGGGVGAAWNEPGVTATFLAAALFCTLAYQLDHVNVAQSRADRALVRSLAQGLVQLAVLAIWLVLGYRELVAIVSAVAIGGAASVLLGLRQLRHSGTPPDWKHGVRAGEMMRILRSGLPNHALLLADRAPGYLLPLVVVAALSAAAGAAWYIVWMLATAVFFVPQSAGYSLQTKLAGNRGSTALVTGALRISLIMTFLAGVLLIAIGPVVLHLLGPQYGSAWMLLLALVPALIVSCVTQVYYGVCRARGKLTEATGVAVFAGIIVIVPAALVLQQQGLGGVSILWLIAQIAAALVAGWRLYALTRPGTGFFPAPARIHGPVDGGGTQ